MDDQQEMKLPQRRTLSLAEQAPIIREMEKVCFLQNGFAAYADGNSDQILAEKFKVSEHNIAHIREAFVGPLPKRRPARGVDALMHEARIAKLEETVAALVRFTRMGLPVDVKS